MAQVNRKNQKSKSIKKRLDKLVRNTEEVRNKINRMKEERSRGDNE